MNGKVDGRGGGCGAGLLFPGGKTKKEILVRREIQFFLRVGKRKVVNDMCQD